MKLTKRDIWILHQLLDFSIARYLMANSCQRLDGAEKADYHIHMSKQLCRFIFAEGDERMGDTENVNASWNEVHDYLADILTDRMDEVIDFPLYTPLYGSMYDPLKDKFFQVIIDHMDEIERVAKEAIKIRH
jgi:hypothetical protein